MSFAKPNYHQRGANSMSQLILPFKYEGDNKENSLTALAGLPIYLELAKTVGLQKAIDDNLQIRKDSQGWTDSQFVLPLILLNIAGGDCVEDINYLEADKGFCKIYRKSERHRLPKKERKKLDQRFRKKRSRIFPSPSAIFRYLGFFHDEKQEHLRQEKKAFIPQPNAFLKVLSIINQKLAGFKGNQSIDDTATLDMDATLIETNKESALFSYKGYKAYQPLNTWWFEQGTVLHTEFRDGNVPAGYQQLRVLKDALDCLPKEVEKVRLRSDTAGYQHEVLEYCAKAKNERFGVIEFAIGCDVTKEFKKAVSEIQESEWKPFYKTMDGHKYETNTQWAEVCFVSNFTGYSKKGPGYRYLVKRQAIDEQLALPGMEEEKEYPFPTLNMKKNKYKIYGLVTNMDWDGQELIEWQHKRCGKSEEAHAIMKDDLAGGTLPSHNFGVNAAWWWIMILAFNLNVLMKRYAMPKEMLHKRMKALRFAFIKLPGWIVNHSRQLIIRMSLKNPALEMIQNARQKIMMLQLAPDG
jgi:hypothetical protein